MGFYWFHNRGAIKAGANVTALVDYNSRNDLGMLKYISKCDENLEIIIGDMRDKYFVNELTKNKEYVFHLAALIGIPYSYIAPNSYIKTNIKVQQIFSRMSREQSKSNSY